MSWHGGTEIFDTVCERVVDAVTYEQLTTTAAEDIISALIAALENRGWDHACTSLGEFQEHDFVKNAFRERGIVVYCLDEHVDEDGRWRYCELEVGEQYHPAGKHVDDTGVCWAVT